MKLLFKSDSLGWAFCLCLRFISRPFLFTIMIMITTLSALPLCTITIILLKPTLYHGSQSHHQHYILACTERTSQDTDLPVPSPLPGHSIDLFPGVRINVDHTPIARLYHRQSVYLRQVKGKLPLATNRTTTTTAGHKHGRQ